ncbi:hypothetical protein HOP50_18g81070 [Chloropicon primus]|uniref:Uncharacterized protein n=1 Tax=Chloropicon primus TaxID=1764295 RepID=A0A5B8N0W9_9CHLO|nr:hypothetical protein A3770_18p80830 [Chloropicon primus]UPR04762.1 hypothetical protein HOP50_18g81070 [Chloropicon primus]|mmetsp:Transcript_10397/g.29447  ORF Transcript_10397/g.29447 Transcript_10397/m.29447 type:complete len:385 (-) Transcript_10397:166-1320(-)|eukprot:QDZ25565.1 hypothetical protein A3770_18p80830 [Chloropicon primus]
MTFLCPVATCATSSSSFRPARHVVVQPQLTCGHCVSCTALEPVSPMERAAVRTEWERQELAWMEGLRVARERYGVEELHSGEEGKSGRTIFSNDEGSCRRKLATILPLIVLRNDGTLVQYDPPPHSVDDRNAAASPGSDSQDSQDSQAAKVTLNGLYRDAGDSVCFSPHSSSSTKESSRRRWGRRQASNVVDDDDDDNLVGVLGLMKIAPSGLRRRRGAGTLASLLLPLKMTNVSITAKVEEAPADVLTEGRYALRNSRRNSEDLLGDEFKDSSSLSSSKRTPSGRGLEHSRSWSWDSCFSSGSSFRDLSNPGLPCTPTKGPATLATSSSASSLAGSLVNNVCSYVNSSSAGIRERIKKSLGSKIYAPMMNDGVSVNPAIIRAS